MSSPIGRSILSGRMRIIVERGKLERFPRKRVRFYMKYASFVLKTLRKPSFQKFLEWMLREENMEGQTIKNVHVRVLPFKRKNGNGLAGNCNTGEGRIRIYPRTLKFCRILVKKFGKESFLSYVKHRARAALIHELLHFKYAKDETKVRELTKQYFLVLTQDRLSNKPGTRDVYDMIFKPQSAMNASAR